MCVLSDIESRYKNLCKLLSFCMIKKQVSALDLELYEEEVQSYETEFNDSRVMKELLQDLCFFIKVSLRSFAV